MKSSSAPRRCAQKALALDPATTSAYRLLAVITCMQKTL